MGLLQVFNKEKNKKSHLKNLIEVAFSDGQMDNDEYILLLSLARKLNINDEEIKKIKENPNSIKFYPPSSSRERFDQIYDLVCMMMVDGVIHRKEMEICKNLALKLGYLPQIVDHFVSSIGDNVRKGISKEQSFKQLSNLIQIR
jgi:uncharacterized tellurite resistance protein B-like protein